MSDLEYVKLSELISEKPRNGLYKGKEFQGKGHRWIKMNEVYGNDFFLDQETELLEVTESERNRFNCQAGDLLFGRTSLTLEGIGDCLLVGDVDDVPIFESNLFRIRFNLEKAYPLFYYYFFKSKAGKLLIQTIAKQTAATSITSTDLIALPVPYFPVDVQKEIADQIYLFDKKIELNHQTNQTLEQIAQAIFKSWFVDFEPTRAKISAKENWQALHQPIETSSPTCYVEQFDSPSQSHISLEEAMTQAAMAAISGKSIAELDQLSPEQLEQLKITAALFPDDLVESELGEIPAGWNVKPLEDVAENHSTTFDFSKVDEVVFVNTGDVLEGRFLHKKYSSKEGLPGQAKKTIKKDDILYSEIRPKNKRFAYVPEGCDDYVVSTKFMIIRSLGFVHPRYLYQILRQETTIREFNLIAESRSGTFPQITFDSIGYMPVVVPTEGTQEAFMNFFAPIIEKIDLVVSEEKSLASLRDLLLPKLLSGQLDVANAA